MKKQNLILFTVLVAFALFSCEKYGGTSSSNLVGDWDIYSITQKTYTNGILDSTQVEEDMGSLTFNSDGDGTYSIYDGEETTSGSFDWFEQNDKVFLNLMNLSDSIMTKNFAIGFDVETNTATNQVWSLTYSYYEEDETPSGYIVNSLKKNYMEMDLRKQ
jgi:hypothetical protein